MVVLSFLIVGHAIAGGKTYTPLQLRRMVSKGQYPPQGPVQQTKTEHADFLACSRTVDSMVEAVAGDYPAQTIADTKIVKVVKIWTNDGAVVASCSALDENLVITVAPYR
jgi:hypothetical protein